jgi:hypothetical protein
MRFGVASTLKKESRLIFDQSRCGTLVHHTNKLQYRATMAAKQLKIDKPFPATLFLHSG